MTTDQKLAVTAPFTRDPLLTGVLLAVLAIAGYVLLKPKDALPVAPVAPYVEPTFPSPPAPKPCGPNGCPKRPARPCGPNSCPGYQPCPFDGGGEAFVSCPFCNAHAGRLSAPSAKAAPSGPTTKAATKK